MPDDPKVSVLAAPISSAISVPRSRERAAASPMGDRDIAASKAEPLQASRPVARSSGARATRDISQQCHRSAAARCHAGGANRNDQSASPARRRAAVARCSFQAILRLRESRAHLEQQQSPGWKNSRLGPGLKSWAPWASRSIGADGVEQETHLRARDIVVKESGREGTRMTNWARPTCPQTGAGP